MATDHESPPSSASDDGSYWDFGLVNVDGGVDSTLAGAASTCSTGDAADVLQPRKSCRVPDSFAHRLSYVSGGSINYHSMAASLGLPPGPRSPAGFSAWPDVVCQNLFSGGLGGRVRRHRFQNMMKNKHVLHTDFSGQGCVEQGLRMMEVACRRNHVRLLLPCLIQYRACDNDRVCHSVLVQSGALHVFGDVLERVPAAHRDTIRALRLKPDEMGNPTDAAHAACHRRKIKKYLKVHGPYIFGPNKAVGDCKIHPGKACPVNAPVEDLPSAESPVRTLVAGTMCTPWSAFGSRSGAAHPANHSHYVWAEDAKQSDFHLVTLENSEYFPVDEFRAHMQPNYLTVHTAICPSLLGWPIRRMRMFATSINLKHLVWLGPIGDKEIVDDFWSLFRAHVEVEADVFSFVDSDANRRAALQALAASRGIFGGYQQSRDVFPPDAKRRLDSYYAQRSQNEGLGGCCVADISQNPAKRTRLGPWFPSFARGTVSCSLIAVPKDDELFPYMFTRREVALAHGWLAIKNTADGDALPYSETMPSVFETISPQQYSLLIGNGMHLHTMTAWLCYVVSHCVPRYSLESWSPVLEARLFSDVDPASDPYADASDTSDTTNN